MKTILRILIGSMVAIVFYMIDATIDYLFLKDVTFVEIAFTIIPTEKIFQRIVCMLLAGTTVFIYFRLRKPGETTRIEKERSETATLLSFLNSFSVVEMIAAQIKTTMNTVLGFMNLLKEKKVSEHARGIFTEYVYSSSTSLLQLFNNLVELHHILNNKTINTISSINVNQVLNDLKKKYDSELKHRTTSHLELKLDFPGENEERVISTDSTKLIAVLESLLQNALGFSDSGIIHFGYSVVRDKEIQFFFRSSAMGISMDQLETAFNMYLNNHSGMDISFDLAALRMEVARRFTDLLGGKIWSRALPEGGSGFYLSIPSLKKIKRINKLDEEEEPIPDWKLKKILIAEDVDTNYMLLKTILKPTRVEIIHAENGSEAVSIFKTNSGKFDAILMDIVMPVMDGFEAAMQIKQLDPSIPIVGQTAYCLDSENENGRLKHFDDFLIKPIWSHELLGSLRKYL